MKVLHDRSVYGMCVIGLVILAGAQGCGDDAETTSGVSNSDAGGTTDVAGGGATSGRAGAGGAARGAAGESGAGQGAAGESGAAGRSSGGGASGRGASAGGSGSVVPGGGGETDPESDAGIDDDAGGGEGEAGSGGSSGEAGSGGSSSEAGSGGGSSEAGSGGSSGEAGSGGSSGEDGRCGTRGGVTCEDDQFCSFEPDAVCGALDAGGVCVDKPEFCPAIYFPVCGCDNHTYASECVANGSGVSAKREGPCSPEECAEAGGRAVYSDGVSLPECAQGEEGWEISGDIQPAMCCLGAEPSGATCGGIASLDCADDEFCNYEPTAGGQGCDGTVADAAGVCQDRPMICTREYAPVCGCDRKSYGNACEAHASGQSVLHENMCNEIDCAAVGGRVVFGIGPAPMCDPDETQFTYVGDSGGGIPIEGAICCVESTM